MAVQGSREPRLQRLFHPPTQQPPVMARDIDDDAYVAELLKQDAKKATKTYELVGIDAFNPRRCVTSFRTRAAVAYTLKVHKHSFAGFLRLTSTG